MPNQLQNCDSKVKELMAHSVHFSANSSTSQPGSQAADRSSRNQRNNNASVMLSSMSSQANIRVQVPGDEKRPSLYSASQASFRGLPGAADASPEASDDGNSSDDDLFKRNKRVRRWKFSLIWLTQITN